MHWLSLLMFLIMAAAATTAAIYLLRAQRFDRLARLEEESSSEPQIDIMEMPAVEDIRAVVGPAVREPVTAPPSHPSGWYPKPGDPRIQAYWDGVRWTATIQWDGSQWVQMS